MLKGLVEIGIGQPLELRGRNATIAGEFKFAHHDRLSSPKWKGTLIHGGPLRDLATKCRMNEDDGQGSQHIDLYP